MPFPIQFDNPLGWYAFGCLGALVLMYMIRPKMIDVKIPSLMFLMKQKGTREKSTFLKKFTTNVLFFLQFLFIALLASAATIPLLSTTYDSTSENTVIVLDVSASMQTRDSAAGTRFDTALKLARKHVRGTTSIILAESVPLVALDKGSESKAQDILSYLKPKETGTNLGDAMVLASDLAGGSSASRLDGRAIVISDFLWTEGADPEVVRTILESRGLAVDFVNVNRNANMEVNAKVNSAKQEDDEGRERGGAAGNAGNIGFVDVSVGNAETTLLVKNYFDAEKDIIVEITGDEREPQAFSKRMLPRSVEKVAFPTRGGVTIAKLAGQKGRGGAGDSGSSGDLGDILDADDYAFVSNPKKGGIRVLVLSNTPNKFLTTALEASGDVTVTESEPPVIPHITPADFDVVVFSDVDAGKLLSGTADELREFVSRGKSFIAMYQEDINALGLRELLPVTIKESYGESEVAVTIENQFTKDITFGSVKKHYRAEADNATIVLATASASGSPLIALKGAGKSRDGSGSGASSGIGAGSGGDAIGGSSGGKLMYYGIDDRESDFKNSPSYPIFWNGVLHFLIGVDSLANFNHKTGKVFSFERELAVQTPKNALTTSKLVMDNAGIYTIGGVKHAANLRDEKESDILRSAALVTTRADAYTPKKVIKEKQVSLELYLIIAALAFLIIELFYSKYRGDF